MLMSRKKETSPYTNPRYNNINILRTINLNDIPSLQRVMIALEARLGPPSSSTSHVEESTCPRDESVFPTAPPLGAPPELFSERTRSERRTAYNSSAFHIQEILSPSRDESVFPTAPPLGAPPELFSERTRAERRTAIASETGGGNNNSRNATTAVQQRPQRTTAGPSQQPNTIDSGYVSRENTTQLAEPVVPFMERRWVHCVMTAIEANAEYILLRKVMERFARAARSDEEVKRVVAEFEALGIEEDMFRNPSWHRDEYEKAWKKFVELENVS